MITLKHRCAGQVGRSHQLTDTNTHTQRTQTRGPRLFISPTRHARNTRHRQRAGVATRQSATGCLTLSNSSKGGGNNAVAPHGTAPTEAAGDVAQAPPDRPPPPPPLARTAQVEALPPLCTQPWMRCITDLGPWRGAPHAAMRRAGESMRGRLPCSARRRAPDAGLGCLVTASQVETRRGCAPAR